MADYYVFTQKEEWWDLEKLPQHKAYCTIYISLFVWKLHKESEAQSYGLVIPEPSSHKRALPASLTIIVKRSPNNTRTREAVTF